MSTGYRPSCRPSASLNQPARSDPSDIVRERFRTWAEDQARLLSDDLIREYDDQPICQHTDKLERLLTWLRTAPLEDREILVALEDGSFVLGQLPGHRGGATRIVEGTRSLTRMDAERLVFHRRVAALRPK